MITAACVYAGCSNAIIELKKSGAPQRWLKLPDDLRGSSFSCFVLIPKVTLRSEPVGKDGCLVPTSKLNYIVLQVIKRTNNFN